MSARFRPMPTLEGEQAKAADPQAHASLSASAGTGKTEVLTARVLRLLVQGARPESLICLTFTKAAAAEMANRIGARQIDCRARSTSTIPDPWNRGSRPRSVAVRQRISLTRRGCPTSSR